MTTRDAATSSFQSDVIPQDRLLPGLLGLRGIAALAVVLFHLVHLAGLPVPAPFAFIASDFGKGVHLFFVLSAFSLMHSTEHTLGRPTWASEYFVKRFFRIAPLYYCIMAGMILWPAFVSGHWTTDLQALLLNLTFTFGFVPWQGIVWAGWSVGVEMLFYVVFPVLLLTIHTRTAALALVAFSLLVGQLARVALDAHFAHTVPLYRYNWGYFSFAANIGFFALGIYAYRVTQSLDRNSIAMRRMLPVLPLLLLGLLLLTDLGRILRSAWHVDLIVWGGAFAALAVWQSVRPGRWSANRVFEHLGERSYSLYLIHPVLIVLLKSPLQAAHAVLAPHLDAYAYFLCAGLLLLPLWLLSEVSYRVIELPFIRYGQRINTRLRRAQPSVSHAISG